MEENIQYKELTCDWCGVKSREYIEPKRFGIFDNFPGWFFVSERSKTSGLGKTHENKHFCSLPCLRNHYNGENPA